jgi:hypothetical protein
MPKFFVTISRTVIQEATFEVEAADDVTAEAKAHQRYRNGPELEWELEEVQNVEVIRNELIKRSKLNVFPALLLRNAFSADAKLFQRPVARHQNSSPPGQLSVSWNRSSATRTISIVMSPAIVAISPSASIAKSLSSLRSAALSRESN